MTGHRKWETVVRPDRIDKPRIEGRELSEYEEREQAYQDGWKDCADVIAEELKKLRGSYDDVQDDRDQAQYDARSDILELVNIIGMSFEAEGGMHAESGEGDG